MTTTATLMEKLAEIQRLDGYSRAQKGKLFHLKVGIGDKLTPELLHNLFTAIEQAQPVNIASEATRTASYQRQAEWFDKHMKKEAIAEGLVVAL